MCVNFSAFMLRRCDFFVFSMFHIRPNKSNLDVNFNPYATLGGGGGTLLFPYIRRSCPFLWVSKFRISIHVGFLKIVFGSSYFMWDGDGGNSYALY